MRQISTVRESQICAICQRNLLAGERHDVFLHAGSRRIVCELCTDRATQQGWMRESGDQAPATGRLGWIRRSQGRSKPGRLSRRSQDPAGDLLVPPEAEGLVDAGDGSLAESTEPDDLEVEPTEPSEFDLPEVAELTVNERAVRAVPTHSDMKGARAVALFNGGEHPRTIASLSRTLGAPVVSVRPSASEGSIVSIVIAWDLSWYGFEVDLADEGSGARLISQGSELEELDEPDRVPNAVADSRGMLHSAVETE